MQPKRTLTRDLENQGEGLHSDLTMEHRKTMTRRRRFALARELFGHRPVVSTGSPRFTEMAVENLSARGGGVQGGLQNATEVTSLSCSRSLRPRCPRQMNG